MEGEDERLKARNCSGNAKEPHNEERVSGKTYIMAISTLFPPWMNISTLEACHFASVLTPFANTIEAHHFASVQTLFANAQLP
jgi:hypothetical protein